MGGYLCSERVQGIGAGEARNKQAGKGLKGKGIEGRSSRPKNERYSRKDAKTCYHKFTQMTDIRLVRMKTARQRLVVREAGMKTGSQRGGQEDW